MSDTATLDRAGDTEAEVAPVASRAQRRADRRRTFTRRALAVTAGAGIAATALAFTALSSPDTAKPTKAPLRLPTANAANAAFLQGLAASKKTPAVVKPAAANPAATGGTEVMIQNYAYSPAALTVSVGSKVTWTNMDTAPHTVTISAGPVKFNSPTLQKGDSFTYTFTTPGTYSYYCAVHPDMKATVTVTGAASSTPTTPAPSSSSGMTMPPPTTGGGTASCAASGALQTLLTHINAAHLGESPAQQVQDILNVDQYIGLHLALFEKMAEPLTNGGLTNALSTTLQSLFTHINAGHLGESPGQQVQDILDVNQYIATHLALVQNMAAGWEALAC